MNLTSWWQSWRGKRAGSVPSPATDLLAKARALLRAGHPSEASEQYWKIKPKHATAEGLVEHAELLLQLGDYFYAVSKAASALELDPGNARALAVQREVSRLEDAEERRRK